MLLTLRMVAEVVVIVLTTKLKEKEIIFGLIGNFLCNFFLLVFFYNYLFSPSLFTWYITLDRKRVVEFKPTWCKLIFFQKIKSILTILFVKTFICLTSKILVILLKLYRCMVFFWNLFISIAGTNTIHFTFNHNLTIPGLYLGSEQCPRKLIS